MYNKSNASRKKYNILFIATYQNYFVNNHASFSRMYNNLIYFHKNRDFNVVVLQPISDINRENSNLKKDIKTYYFREIEIFGYNLVPFIDFNPFFIHKIIKIVKKHEINLIHVDYLYGINILRFIRKISVSYNAYNVESIFANQVGKYYYKIPRAFQAIFTKYIYLLEKYVLKFVKNVNAVSIFDKQKFIEIYKVPKEKIIISPFGYRTNIVNNPIPQDIAKKRMNLDTSKFIVIFHGSYHGNYANIEAINIIKNKIAPRIIDENIMFLIAGKMPPFKNKRNLRFLGFLDDLNNFIYAADIAIVPILRGSGVKTKIIDYLSGNIPVITTKEGAKGILLENGVHGYIVDNPVDDIIKKILELKNNPKKIKTLKNYIREFIKEHHDWKKILEKLAERYEKIIEFFRK